MPPIEGNGRWDPSAIPDFVAVAGRDAAIAGYVEKRALLDMDEAVWPVYARDLQTIVGHLFPDKGFVAIGVDPATVPNAVVSVGPLRPIDPASPPVVIAYIHNASPDPVWFAVLEDEKYTQGAEYWGGGYGGAGCFTISPNARLVILDGDPTNPATAPRAIVYVQGSENTRAERSVEIDGHGIATIRTGMPPWWQAPPPC